MVLLANLLFLQRSSVQIEALPISPFGISADGKVVFGMDGKHEPCIWKGNRLTRLATAPGFKNGFISSASRDGSVFAGTANRGEESYACRWRNGKFLAICPVNWSWGIYGPQVSSDGETVVGTSYDGNAENGRIGWAFRWTEASGVQRLALSDVAGAGCSFNGETVVGTVQVASPRRVDHAGGRTGGELDGTSRPCVWDSAGKETLLPLSSYFSSGIVLGCSSDGQTILGLGNTRDYVKCVLWKPGSRIVPLPMPRHDPSIIQPIISGDGRTVWASQGSSPNRTGSIVFWRDGAGPKRLPDFLKSRSIRQPFSELAFPAGCSNDGRTLVVNGGNDRPGWLIRLPLP